MKFKNHQPHDVYINLGTLKRIPPGEIIELQGILTCPPLTPLFEEKETKTSKKKVPKKKPVKNKKS